MASLLLAAACYGSIAAMCSAVVALMELCGSVAALLRLAAWLQLSYCCDVKLQQALQLTKPLTSAPSWCSLTIDQ